MPNDIGQDNKSINPSEGVSAVDIAELQKAMADFLVNVRRLHGEHEQAIRHILKDIDQRKAEAIRDSIKNNYGA